MKLWIKLAAALLSGACTVASAQNFPNRPVRIILAITPGSVADAIARFMSQDLTARLGQPVVVENRAGGGGAVAAEACKQAPADGHTLCMLHVSTFSLNPFTMQRLSYDPFKDFKPVTRMFFINEALVVSPAVAARSVEELRKLLVANSGKFSYATLQLPGADYFQAGLSEQWGAQVIAIPFKGGGEVVTALLSDQVNIGYAGAGNFAEHVKAGKIRMLAVNAGSRLKEFPNVPTFGEAGIKPFKIKAWWGMFAPAGTPEEIVNRVNTELSRSLADAKVRQYVEERFMESAVTANPAEFASFVRQDYERGGALVEEIKRAAGNK
ncbi:Bug family tripartite tricarboxylate transporter substrate binding protein [Ottowia thiooxydans]|uniref:Tripartite-type tricarboxylate transporter receptor subunit TctC n=1 Tax=Ottowia thiooxydans TaxID=219182 RepID=A0ABV2Q8V8_9BURK